MFSFFQRKPNNLREATALFRRAATALEKAGYQTEVKTYAEGQVYLTVYNAKGKEAVAVKYETEDYPARDKDFVACYFGDCRGLPKGKMKYQDFTTKVSFDRLVAALLTAAKRS
jgi:hypothetical protein